MLGIELVRIRSVINSPFRVTVVFVVFFLMVIIIINSV
ncbi:hypothetical protein Desaci_3177 [Desulfosporosinus acidiphilus SJ4]|uniref:Uncharacterized protein n=1 Tax=Desulfosporosinus acidiphilus (strain DSM 22704 / JCM 16185 / SJ4) TaxID=646529 RepID=I4D8F7_DESAJ|nr:hypothetical protein Desaci_3177 [Desulfosporosinus acidiphilus SJ4]